MEEFIEKDDELRSLMKEEGLLVTAPDFTDRVMQLVEAGETAKATTYEPLLGRKAWTLIITGTTLLMAFCWWALSSENTGESEFISKLKPVSDFFSTIDLSIHFNSNALLIASIAIACMGILLSLDILLSGRYNKASM